MPFVKARLLKPKHVLYVDHQGNRFIFEGGSRAWRTHNPGNIRFGTFADAAGAIGNDGVNAVFPDRETGKRAIKTLLRTKAYQGLTIAGAIDRYAPPSDGNPTPGYQTFVARQTGLDIDREMSSLTSAELDKLVAAISIFEGWRAGTVRQLDSAEPPAAHLPGAAPVLTETLPLSAVADAGSWMRIAQREAELEPIQRSQWADPGENPRILRYFEEAVASWFTEDDRSGDETDWCAAFVNWCLEQAGYDGTQHPGARSFFWPSRKFVKIDRPAFGSIVVFRDAPFGDAEWRVGSGHVGFVLKDLGNGRIRVLGGNQGGTVQPMEYAVQTASRRVVAYLMPAKN
jgi:uncharacterized protein (TIGR02594 family)